MSERKLVVAYGKNGEIGAGDALPWHMPADLRYFREVTAGDSLIMGGNTWRSIGRVLPGREMIVVTRRERELPGVIVARSLKEAYERASRPSISAIGGASIYLQALEAALVDHIYATEINASFPSADAFFHLPTSGWDEISRDKHSADSANKHDYDFVTYTRAQDYERRKGPNR